MKKVKLTTACGHEHVVEVDTDQKITGFEVVVEKERLQKIEFSNDWGWIINVSAYGYYIDNSDPPGNYYYLRDAVGNSVASIYKPGLREVKR